MRKSGGGVHRLLCWTGRGFTRQRCGNSQSRDDYFMKAGPRRNSTCTRPSIELFPYPRSQRSPQQMSPCLRKPVSKQMTDTHKTIRTCAVAESSICLPCLPVCDIFIEGFLRDPFGRVMLSFAQFCHSTLPCK